MQDLPISLDVNEGPLTEPEWILQCQTIQCQNQSVSQLLVKWKGQAMEEATWIDELDLEGQFPEFNFKDKVTSQAGGNDRERLGPRPLSVYTRRAKRAKARNLTVERNVATKQRQRRRNTTWQELVVTTKGYSTI